MMAVGFESTNLLLFFISSHFNQICPFCVTLYIQPKDQKITDGTTLQPDTHVFQIADKLFYKHTVQHAWLFR